MMNRYNSWLLILPLLLDTAYGGVNIVYGTLPAPKAKVENLGISGVPAPAASDLKVSALEQAEDLAMIVDHKTSILRHVGEMPPILPAISSHGKNTPLWFALDSLTPENWQVYADKSVDVKRRVDWSIFHKNWIHGIHELGVSYEVAFDIDWERKILVVRDRERLVDHQFIKGQAEDVMLTIDGGAEIPAGKEGLLIIDGQVIKVTRGGVLNGQ